MYDVTTIGALAPAWPPLRWEDIPPGWVPSGAPGLPGEAAPVPGPPRPAPVEAVSAPLLASIAIVGVLAGALGFWAWGRR
jgi:hypothetical protein